MAKRSKKRSAERAKRRVQKQHGMANPGGASRYARKKDGEIPRQYRLEGSYLLDPAHMRVHKMPAPFVVQIVESAA